MGTGPGLIGYDVFDKFIKLLLQKIMGAFFAPLLVISGAKLYFLGAVLPFALVYFRCCYVPTAQCSHSPIFPQPYVPTFLRAFSKLGLMFPQLCVPTFLIFITKLGPMFLQFI